MDRAGLANKIVNEMERVSPYMYEGLYGTFLQNFMHSNKRKWTLELAEHLGDIDDEWQGLTDEIAVILWDRFEERISC